MKQVKNLAKYLLRPILKSKALDTLSDLRNANGDLRLIGCALSETFQDEITSDERWWIDKIELLREELNSSSQQIKIVDYGAGEPGLDLTSEEMHGGRAVNKTIGEVSRNASKPYLWSLLLFKLIRNFKPITCLELGTCLGISASYQASALNLNGMGKLITMEGAESLASLAEKHFLSLGLNNVAVVVGNFQDTLEGVLNTNKPIDYAFIDGHHDEIATLAYFEQITPFLSDRAILVFDDISWSNGMKRAWKAIMSDERIKISVDLRQIGICIIDSRINGRKSFAIPMI